MRHRTGAWWWCGVAAVLAAGSVVAVGQPSLGIDWQPAHALDQPWRWWSAAWVHYSDRHLLANLAGAVLVAALGVASRMPRQAAIAWLVAWPLLHGMLLAAPALRHYGGLSGVLHAGVAVVAVVMLRHPPFARQAVGAAILGGLVVKAMMEAPWESVLHHPAGWDIATAPIAHVAGISVGALLALCVSAPPERV